MRLPASAALLLLLPLLRHDADVLVPVAFLMLAAGGALGVPQQMGFSVMPMQHGLVRINTCVF